MHCSAPTLFRAWVLLALLLSSERLSAQESQGAQSQAAATAQPPTVPELADLIPLATVLSGRLASLEKTLADGADLSRIEQQFGQINARLDEYAKQIVALKDSHDQRAGRLPQLNAEIKSAEDALARVSKPVTEKVRVLGKLRKEWLAQQKQWNAWQAALHEDEPLEEITTVLTKIQGVIDTALGLLQQQLRPLLVLQEQAGTLQIRINAQIAEVEGLISLTQGGVMVDASPAMFSAQYFAQLTTMFWDGAQTQLVQISWPEKSFFTEQGWIIALQGLLSLVLAFVFFRHRQQLERLEHWRIVARRPIAAGLLVGILSVAVFYERPPAMLLVVLSTTLGIAFVRLVGDLVGGGWRSQFLYVSLILLILTNLCYAIGLPLALLRLYILAAALVSLVYCLRWAATSRRQGETRLYAWGLRLAAVFFGIVLFTELWGEAKLAEFFFVSSLRTLAVVLAFGLLRHIVRGGLEWAVLSSSARGVALVRHNTTVVMQRLTFLLDVLIGVVIFSALLMTWRVYDSPVDAITGLLSMQATIGSRQITIGLVLMAVGSLGGSYLASWMLQILLTENVLARRNVDLGVSHSVTRLLHYALISLGLVIALVVLGVDLTKMTLLVSALGVGIGFGLQTIVNNFVCGLILLFERPLRVGDTIEINGKSVIISKIGLRSTTVRTFDQADVIVPNTDLVSNQVTNWTLTDRHARAILPVGVAYGSDIALVMRTLKECALAHPGVMKNPEPRIFFRSFGDSALNLELYVWVEDIDTRLRIESDLYQEIDRRFRQAGIEIPFPQRDLHVRSV